MSERPAAGATEKTRDFLLELRCEEIPARMQAGARADLEKLFRKELADAGIAPGEVTVWSTPRRLALIARGLPQATEAVSEELKGPRTTAPEQALEGFLRKTGLSKDHLTERDGVWFAVLEKPGRTTREVLAEAIPAIVRAFPWPKSMRWGAGSINSSSPRWVRPLSGIVAIFGEELVSCEAGGVQSGYATRGHRFHAPGEITIGSAADYAEKLRACHVIVNHEERQDLIRSRAREAAEAAGLRVIEDEGLVVENAGLTEWPVPLLGRFDEAFLEVPPEVIQLTARTNQKYFVCEDQSGKLANAFVCTANISPTDGGAGVVDGNRKVLAARLSDARFFWEQDRKKTLEQHAEGLARITFHEKLGTVADKVERVAKLARWLVESDIVVPGKAPGPLASVSETASTRPAIPAGAGMTKEALADMAEQAARQCKADLVTEMVGEFPELQGLMGGYYARAEGLPDAVADAIRDHYKPVGQGDDVPTAPVTVAVSLADKLDTIAQFFAVGLKPTGSKDPFALRRATLGAIDLILKSELRASFTELLLEVRRLRIDQLKGQAAVLVDGIAKDGALKWRSLDVDRHYQATSDLWYFRDFSVSPEAGFEYIDGLQERDAILTIVVAPLEFTLGTKAFFADRLKVQQKEAGVRHDLIDAVFATKNENGGGEDDLVRLLARVHALQAFVGSPDGANLLAGYKRAANILKKEEYPVTPAQAGVHPSAGADGEMDSRLRGNDETGANPLSYTPEPAEKALIDALALAGPQAAGAVAAEDFAGAMAALASLRGPIDAFFDSVTVNDADPAKRRARLELLAAFRDAVHQVADFSRIEG
jgi:glycyl-tRNA synthetase beta chain